LNRADSLLDYDFGAPPPWRSSEWLADGVALPVVVDGEWD
jgi:hypothetical protein